MNQFQQLTSLTSGALLLTSALFAVPSFANESNDHNSHTVRPGTVIYKISANASPRELKSLNALLKGQGLVKERTLEGSQIVIATFEHKGREKAISNILKHSGYVEFAEPDYAIPPTLQPNDPAFTNQWHHNTVNSQQAWDVTTGSNSVLVAVCDTGFDVNHPDLAANMRTDLAYNAQDGSNYIYDANGHGTGTAGTLGAVGNNAVGVSGVNWNVDIIPVRIAISDTNSSAYTSTMAKCIEYAADNGARVVNLSYGGIQYATIDTVAKYLRSKNGLLFMSAGNEGQEFPTYPDYTSFVGVGATDQSNNKASFSSWGDYVDITAPGVSIRTTYPDNRYVNYSGTSFSAPLTAGVAALMVAANPSITVSELETGLLSTAVDIGAAGDDNVFGHGLVNAQAAVNYAINLDSFIAPVADIAVSATSVPFGSAINLSAANSSDSDGNIVTYQWNLGDGTSSNQVDVVHTYAAAGSYQVGLTVTDNDGLTSSDTVVIQVTNEVPVAVIDDMQLSYNLGDTLFFSGTSSSDSDGNIVDHAWQFGDGQSASGVTASHVFNTAGTYTVTLTVTDNAGALNSASVQVTVSDPFALNAPDDLSAQTDGLSVALSWRDNSGNEDSFILERGQKTRGKVRFSVIAVVAANTTQFDDIVPNTGTYSYRVTAANAVDEATSATLRVSVEESSTPPPGQLSAPTNLSALQSGSSVVLNWNDTSSNELGFYLERGLKRKGKVTFTRIADIPADSTSLTDNVSGLSGSYVYRIQAYASAEVSAFSNNAELRIK